jgi:hypothetical protein
VLPEGTKQKAMDWVIDPRLVGHVFATAIPRVRAGVPWTEVRAAAANAIPWSKRGKRSVCKTKSAASPT